MVVAALVGVCGPVSAQSLGLGPSGSVTLSAAAAGVQITTSAANLNGPVISWSSSNNVVINSGTGTPGAIAATTAGVIGRGPSLIAGVNPPARVPASVTQAAPAAAVAVTPQPRGVQPSNPALGVAPAGAQHGTATVRDSGLVGVVGASAARSSVIIATLEKVTVGGAEALTVDLAGDGLLQLQVARPVLDIHGQALSAGGGGTVALSASAARDVVSGVTNVQGHNAARSVTSQGGVIVFGR